MMENEGKYDQLLVYLQSIIKKKYEYENAKTIMAAGSHPHQQSILRLL